MVNHPRRSVLDRLRGDKRVEHVDDERKSGNSVIVTLKQGWSFDVLADNRVAGEDTSSKALALVRQSAAFAGPYTD